LLSSPLSFTPLVAYCYIHSFPTRRSSDLLKTHSKYIEELCTEIYPVNEEYESCGVFIKLGTLIEYEDVSQEILFDNIHKQIVEEDRKSTRLNSSHVSISYAVFCLKKKTSS